MAPMRFVSLFAAVCSFLPSSHATDSEPLSPMDFKLALNDLGTPNFDSEIARSERLSERSNDLQDYHQPVKRYGSGADYWFAQIDRSKGKPAYGRNSSYVLYRNVKDWGALGDGTTDDTAAIQAATDDGNRCTEFTGGYENCQTVNDDGVCGCDSQTTTPAIVYFPPGTYRISKPILMPYYSSFVGDANNLPTLKATSDFTSTAGILDPDPYNGFYDHQWYQNQNNFWRQVRNFVFDTTDVPVTRDMHALHWQVAQGASLQNIVINMPTRATHPNDFQNCKHIGIFMENGSSQWLEDVIINGGYQGAWFGNQQLNVRNMTLNGCQTGIYQGWGWVWSYSGMTFDDCDVGYNMSVGGLHPTYNNIVFGDSLWNNCGVGIQVGFNQTTSPPASGGLVIDHCRFVNTAITIRQNNGTVILPGCGDSPCQGTEEITLWVQGHTYSVYDGTTVASGGRCYAANADLKRVQQTWPRGPPKAANLLNAQGNFVSRSRPQYEGVSINNFRSMVNDGGCPNDGVTDATACVQAFFWMLQNCAAAGCVGFVDHGAYVIRNTIQVPNNIKLVGEIWPYFMVTGDNFKDPSDPRVAFRVGNRGDNNGTTEIVEIIFQTIGPTPGAILMEWNLGCSEPASCGMFDTHWRIGGTNGTQLQNYNCKKRPTRPHGANAATAPLDQCYCAFLLLHVTATARNMIMSHNWGWVADHELDLDGKDQIDIYNGRGFLIESQGPMWIWGSSSEHSMMYNFQFANAANIYAGLMQSETAYMQTNPNSISAFTPNATWNDPTFEECFVQRCYKTIALRIFNSSYIYSYGAGLYSFFENYDSACLLTQDCDQKRVVLEKSEGIYMYGFTSVAASYMFEVDDELLGDALDNEAFFGNALALLEYP